MPIVDLLLVQAEGRTEPAAQAVADAVATCLDAPPGRVWVRLRRMDTRDYAENQTCLKADELPAFVTLLHAHPPEGEARADEVRRLTGALAACLGRPAERVHLEYAEAGAGRIAFGGRLVR